MPRAMSSSRRSRRRSGTRRRRRRPAPPARQARAGCRPRSRKKTGVGDRRHVVGDHELLEEAEQRRARALARLAPARARADAITCGSSVCGAHDRTGHEVREEADEEREVAEVLVGSHLAAVDVDRVAHRLERVEADARRQHDAERGPGRVEAEEARAASASSSTKKSKYLKKPRMREVRHHADDEECLAPRASGRRRGAAGRRRTATPTAVAERHRRLRRGVGQAPRTARVVPAIRPAASWP